MAILDRFRTHPRQKHPDPAVRLAFVQEIPLSEHELLAEMAREDDDARVRRAAVGKLLNPAALGAIAATDADEHVRLEAAAMLRDVALEAFEGIGETESLSAVDALTDARALANVAKSAPREATAVRALARVIEGQDQRILGSVARHAEHESVRRAAFESLQDLDEIRGVALTSEFREPALAAVDRIADRESLEQIAARAKNKAAARRARTLIRETEERAAQDAADQSAQRAAAAAEATAARTAEARALEAAQRLRDDAERQAALEAGRAEAAARQRLIDDAAARRREAQDVADQARREAAAEAARKDAERRAARLVELADDAARVAAVEDIASARRQFGVVRREWADVS